MSLRGQILAWSMALRSHARRVRSGVYDRAQLADDLQHLADEAVRVAQTIDPEPAQIPGDGPGPEDDFEAADTLELEIEAVLPSGRPRAKA